MWHFPSLNIKWKGLPTYFEDINFQHQAFTFCKHFVKAFPNRFLSEVNLAWSTKKIWFPIAVLTNTLHFYQQNNCDAIQKYNANVTKSAKINKTRHQCCTKVSVDIRKSANMQFIHDIVALQTIPSKISNLKLSKQKLYIIVYIRINENLQLNLKNTFIWPQIEQSCRTF